MENETLLVIKKRKIVAEIEGELEIRYAPIYSKPLTCRNLDQIILNIDTKDRKSLKKAWKIETDKKEKNIEEIVFSQKLKKIFWVWTLNSYDNVLHLIEIDYPIKNYINPKKLFFYYL